MKTIIVMLMAVVMVGCYESAQMQQELSIVECVTDEDCAGCVGPMIECEIDPSTGLCLDGHVNCNACGSEFEYCCSLDDSCRFMACIDGACKAADETPCRDNAECDAWCIGRDYASGGVRCLGGDPRDYSGACDDCTCNYSL